MEPKFTSHIYDLYMMMAKYLVETFVYSNKGVFPRSNRSSIPSTLFRYTYEMCAGVLRIKNLHLYCHYTNGHLLVRHQIIAH